MDNRYAPQYTHPYAQQQEAYAPKTAINELDTFMSGLTDADRAGIFSHEAFGGHFADFSSKFMFYLLQSEIGAGYINSSPARRESAERLKLMAHTIYADSKQSQTSELEELRKQNAEMQKKIDKLSAKEVKA